VVPQRPPGDDQPDEPLGLGHRERSHEQLVEEREQRRVRPDAEGEREHGGHHQPRRAPQAPHGHAQVVADRVEQFPDVHASLPALGRGVEALARLVQGAEAPLGLGPGSVGGESLVARELRGAELEVQADLVVDLVLHARAAPCGEAEQAGDAGADLAGAERARGRHRGAPRQAGAGAVRMPVTASAYRTQRAVSAARWAVPTAVSR
jgi:hypothetical protein